MENDGRDPSDADSKEENFHAFMSGYEQFSLHDVSDYRFDSYAHHSIRDN